MTRIHHAVSVLILLTYAATGRTASCDNLRDVGDTLTFALPLSAIALTTLKGDWRQGGVQMTKTFVYTGAGAGFFQSRW